MLLCISIILHFKKLFNKYYTESEYDKMILAYSFCRGINHEDNFLNIVDKVNINIYSNFFIKDYLENYRYIDKYLVIN